MVLEELGNLFRLLLNHPTIKVVAINDIADTKTMAHLLKYDSIWSFPIKFCLREVVLVEEKHFLFSHEKT
jgi:glyceraldehyde 3-phosphate dehydrogenase